MLTEIVIHLNGHQRHLFNDVRVGLIILAVIFVGMCVRYWMSLRHRTLTQEVRGRLLLTMSLTIGSIATVITQVERLGQDVRWTFFLFVLMIVFGIWGMLHLLRFKS